MELARELGLPDYAGAQLCSWIYGKHANGFEDMTDISKPARDKLDADFVVGGRSPISSAVSSDGTRKYLFPTSIGEPVEAVFIPEGERGTLCLSTQAGCGRGCRFCLTGRQGFAGNLESGDIVNQFRSLPERDNVTNVVYMGMGEPLDNIENVLQSLQLFNADFGYGMSPSRITVSTVGILPELRRLVEDTRCNLALSLHSPFEDERRRIMPVQREHPLSEILAALREYRFNDTRRLSFEYILFEDLNDSERHAFALARMLRRFRCRINLIPFNTFPIRDARRRDADRQKLRQYAVRRQEARRQDAAFSPSGEESIRKFQSVLLSKGLKTTVRKSRGADIAAACGMLAT